MSHRLVIPALSGGASTGAKIEAPTVTAIRLVYGVGSGREAVPSGTDWKPTYAVEIPLFSLGGLDPDGVYEFDAAGLLRTIQSRAERRRWGLRLELSIEQTAAAVAAGDVVVTAPNAAGELSVIGPARGTTTEGGGRKLVVGTGVVVDPDAVDTLSGAYGIEAGDAAPRKVTVALNRFEFEG